MKTVQSMQNRTRMLFRLWLIVATAFVTLSVLLTATYAWFTSNRYTQTDSVSVRSGEQELKLEIAPSAGGPFGEEATISQISTGEILDPVSTADLVTFYRNTAMVNDKAVSFEKTELGYYHGQVFLQATATNQPEQAVMNLYLDTDGIAVTEGEAAGAMISAARVGLTFEGAELADGAAGPMIFFLSTNSVSGSAVNTAGATGDVVLSGPGVTVADPAVDPKEYMVTGTGDVQLPEKPLAVLPLNKVVTVDVYFYLEGCDPDCVNSIRTTEMSIQLPFFGVLSVKGGA